MFCCLPLLLLFFFLFESSSGRRGKGFISRLDVELEKINDLIEKSCLIIYPEIESTRTGGGGGRGSSIIDI
jgi:hypothetical protein